MTSTYEWRARHFAAISNPRPDEKPLVELLSAVDAIVAEHGDDGVLRDGVVQLILGTRVLLNASWGSRLDMGTIDGSLVALAESMGYDVDTESF